MSDNGGAIALVDAKELSVSSDIISSIVIKGDLAALTPAAKVEYYRGLCRHVGLDPVTQPFSLLRLSGKEVMYANKSATDQLRVLHGVSVTDLIGQKVEDIYIVTAKGTAKNGRTDAATGAVNVAGLKGDALANALMKAETKAKRRLTLSLCGLGMLDESEIETIPEARTTTSITTDATSEDAGPQQAPAPAPAGPPTASLIDREKQAMASIKRDGEIVGGDALTTARDVINELIASRKEGKITPEEYVTKLEVLAGKIADRIKW